MLPLILPCRLCSHLSEAPRRLMQLLKNLCMYYQSIPLNRFHSDLVDLNEI